MPLSWTRNAKAPDTKCSLLTSLIREGIPMVRLTQIYTRTGDNGTTGLSDFSRTNKTDARIAALAAVDLANSAFGVALAYLPTIGDRHPQLADALHGIQSRLFDLGADLATPAAPRYEYPPVRMTATDITDLEKRIDALNADLPSLTSFIMPTGTPLAAHMHVARASAREAELSIWTAIGDHGQFNSDIDATPETAGAINVNAVRYMNRFADLLFVAARYAMIDHGGDTLWVPRQ